MNESPHVHVWHGVGVVPIMFRRKDRPSVRSAPVHVMDRKAEGWSGVITIDNGERVFHCIVRACDCGEWYYQPTEFRPDKVRPYPEGYE